MNCIYNSLRILILFPCSVGGGSLFSSASGTPGSIQAAAAALVPPGLGLTPVAYFPPTNSQTLKAISVIFLEAPTTGRKKRHAKSSSFAKRKKGDHSYIKWFEIVMLFYTISSIYD